MRNGVIVVKFSRSMTLWATVLGFSALFGGATFVLAQDEDRTTAGQVMDRETLKAFVLSARDYVSNISDPDELTALSRVLREEGGDWKDGNTFLIILELNGVIRLHGDDLTVTGKDLSDVEDDDGEKVFPKMVMEAQSGDEGGFVEYTWDDPSDPNDTNPKVCYAVQYASPLSPVPFLMVGGYYQGHFRCGARHRRISRSSCDHGPQCRRQGDTQGFRTRSHWLDPRGLRPARLQSVRTVERTPQRGRSLEKGDPLTCTS